MVGKFLKIKRKESNLTLKNIASQTCIRYRYLDAIENEEYKKVPAEIFLRSYIKDYAKSLSLDPHEIIKMYENEREKFHEPVQTFPERKKKNKNYFKKYIPPIVGIVILFLIPRFSQQPFHEDSTKKSEIKEKANKVISYIPDTLSPKEAIAQPVHSLILEAEEETWVSILIDGSDKGVMTLKPGMVKEWTAKNSFDLKIGKPGRIKVILDGKYLSLPEEKDQVISFHLQEKITTPGIS